MITKNRKVTEVEAARIFKKHGTTITIEEAQLIVAFLYRFGKVTLDSILKGKK